MKNLLAIFALSIVIAACAQQEEVVVEVVDPDTGEVTYETRGD